jgi:hypothetical protein
MAVPQIAKRLEYEMGINKRSFHRPSRVVHGRANSVDCSPQDASLLLAGVPNVRLGSKRVNLAA